MSSFQVSVIRKIFLSLVLSLYAVLLVFQFYKKDELIISAPAIIRLGVQLGVVTLILVSAFGLGWLWFKLILKADPMTGLEKMVVFALGFITLSGIGYLLCILQLVGQWTVFIILSLTFFFGLYRILYVPRDLLGKPDHLNGWQIPLDFILFLFLLLCLIHALSPPEKWDSLVYHLVLPKFYLTTGGFSHMPGNIYEGFPQNQKMIYTLIMAVSGAISAKLFSFCCALLVLRTLFLMGKEFFHSTWAAHWAVFFFAVCGTFFFKAQSSYVGLALCFFILLMLYAAFRFRESQNISWLFISGILAGGAVSIKYTAIGSIAATSLLILLWSRKHRLAQAFLFLALAFSLLIPWLLKNLIVNGNPFFPFMIGLLDGGEWNQVLQERDMYDSFVEGMGRTWFDYLALFPRLFLFGKMQSFWFDAQYNIFILLLAPVFLLISGSRKNLWLLGWFLVVFIIWAVGPQQGRFIMPGIAVLALVAGAAFTRVLARVNKPLALSIVVFVMVISFARVPRHKYDIRDELKYVTGRISLEQYIANSRDQLGLIRMNELLAINEITPPGSRIFMLWENRGFYLERDYFPDISFNASYNKQLIANMGSAEKFSDWLKQNDFDYIYSGRLWPWDSDKFLQPDTLDEFRQAQEIYRDFVEKYGELVFREQGELVRVK